LAESAALLVEKVLPEQPVRQWVLSFPYPLRFLLSSRLAIKGSEPFIHDSGIITQSSGLVLIVSRGEIRAALLNLA
jgi:hypothetical protein